jgi:ABC-type antimicrobial peptide transport system permease subunit
VYAPELFLVARTTSSTPMAIAAVRQALRAVDPDLGVLDSGTAAAMLNDDSLFFEITGGIATMLGVVALGLAAAGLFGVLSHLVAMRTREIGVRMALGADARRIRQMILRQGITPIVLGLILGLGLGAIPRMALRPQFRGLLPAFDVAAVAAVSLLFALVGLAASYWPAARASRVDPNVALKNL